MTGYDPARNLVTLALQLAVETGALGPDDTTTAEFTVGSTRLPLTVANLALFVEVAWHV